MEQWSRGAVETWPTRYIRAKFYSVPSCLLETDYHFRRSTYLGRVNDLGRPYYLVVVMYSLTYCSFAVTTTGSSPIAIATSALKF
ncbi:hypothetical protein L211DRAFT_81584 [Terfezia boudieri ATCC MYA-4762]|uniref:Uncharacterized protein n=1 Tax=Terfezia boudieri ATCC MYA-4762 TaxID=1051890 RepID=A0A3N4LRB2_9PEZI|nr:hypothetical protein L211DRAFT_81584 [Terfezia boudieri ATCC MYA-4762]